MKLVGLIVNPIAGLGGSVGLKGTDGNLYKKALSMGAKYVTPNIVKEFLNRINQKDNVLFLTAPAQMGEDYFEGTNFKFRVIGKIGIQTSSKDTKSIAKLVLINKADFLVFFGGDGTARDIYDAIGLQVPVIAVPSGVKMFSAVFALNSKAAAQIFDSLIKNDIEFEEREVLDIDEKSYRKNILKSKLYGYLQVPKVKNLIQACKDSSHLGPSYQINKKEIAEYIIEKMEEDVLYLLGPGTTVKAICDQLKQPKTLLGIDALYKFEIIAQDINENDIKKLMRTNKKIIIILSPIGQQGFILGRGNKQLTPSILSSVEKENFIIISTRKKLEKLRTLKVDTGMLKLDEFFKGFITVIVGYKEEKVIRVN